MAKSNMSETPREVLQGRLGAVRKVRITMAAIFGVIILVWVVGGYWRQNLLLFLSTVVLAFGSIAAVGASQGWLLAELRRREGEE